MPKFFLSNTAIQDLSEIWDYTYEAWSESQADKYYELLIGFCKEISKNPGLGKNYNEIEPGIFGYKVSQHIIFYRLIRPNEIEILRFLHIRMDLKNKIQE